MKNIICENVDNHNCDENYYKFKVKKYPNDNWRIVEVCSHDFESIQDDYFDNRYISERKIK